MVYEPSDDTYLMTDSIIDVDKKYPIFRKKVLEVGCGNCVNSVFMAKLGADVYALDLDNDALTYGKNEAKKQSVQINFIHSDMFLNLNQKDFDLIIFNPPYLPSDEIKHMDLDGLENGRHFIDVFLKDFDKFLSKNGRVLLLHTDYNDLNKTIDIIMSKGFRFEIVKRKKLFFEELFVFHIYRN